jgi:hypothetical protein
MGSIHSLAAWLVAAAEAGSESVFLRFSEDKLQIVALTFMAVIYVIKVRWILSYTAGKERQAGTGDPTTSGPRGARWSLFNIFMPWAMSSTRQHPIFYLSFGIFHLSVAAAIGMSVILPYWPQVYASPLVLWGSKLLFGTACIIGLVRLIRRMTNQYVKAISTPDDYFAVALLTVWFAFAFKAVDNNYQQTEFWLLGFFLLTAFFLFYVPFSKISHYIFYPFTRWYLGRTMGHRGVYPIPVDMDAIKRTVFRPNQFAEGKSK